VSKSKESYQDRLRRLIEKHGQFHTIYRTKFGIVEGYKKAEALIGVQPSPLDKVPRFGTLEADTVEEHLRLCKILAPQRLKGNELKEYANKRAQEFLKLGVEPGKIASLLSDICHTTPRYMRKILPDKFKDQSQQRKLGEQSSPKLSKQARLISRLRSKYDWLDKEGALRGIKDPEFLLSLAEAHYTTVRLSKASIPELLEVTYAKLEEAGFSKQNEETMLFWKFLAEEYQKGFGS
jgi:hypothetical protein